MVSKQNKFVRWTEHFVCLKWRLKKTICQWIPSVMRFTFVEWTSALTLFRMGFFRAAHGLGGGGSHISYNVEAWHRYTLPKEDPKNIWITWHIPWVLLRSAFFHQKSANLAISRNTDVDCILISNFYLF